jgi:tetratricopeptide (TPR) repeat protein
MQRLILIAVSMVICLSAAPIFATTSPYVGDDGGALLRGDIMSDYSLGQMRSAGLLQPEEEILYYYSDSSSVGFLDSGNFFTDRRVVSYWRKDDELQVRQATYPEIESIEMGDFPDDEALRQISIVTEDGEAFFLVVTVDEGGHEIFSRALREQHARARQSMDADPIQEQVMPNHRILLKAGIRLHDAGDYDGAIAIYRQILQKDPDHVTALYELALSTEAKGDYSEVIPLLRKILRSGGGDRAACFELLGSTYDKLGELAKGEDAFRQGLSEFADRASLRFNLGVNLLMQRKLDEATVQLMENLRRRTEHGNGWRILAVTLEGAGQRQRAFFAYARFLSLVPDSPFAMTVASKIWDLLFKGVDLEDKEIVISRSEDLHSVAGAVSLSIAAAKRNEAPWKERTDAQFFAHALDRVVVYSSELGADSASEEFWDPYLMRYFREARDAGHLEAMAYDLRRPLGEAETDLWIAEHRTAIEGYRTWSRGWVVQ